MLPRFQRALLGQIVAEISSRFLDRVGLNKITNNYQTILTVPSVSQLPWKEMSAASQTQLSDCWENLRGQDPLERLSLKTPQEPRKWSALNTYTVPELTMVQLTIFQLNNGVKGMAFSTKCTLSFGFWSFPGLTIRGTMLWLCWTVVASGQPRHHKGEPPNALRCVHC